MWIAAPSGLFELAIIVIPVKLIVAQVAKRDPPLIAAELCSNTLLPLIFTLLARM